MYAIAELCTLGKLPKIEISRVTLNTVEKITTINKSINGKSRGVLVTNTLPFITQDRLHRKTSIKTALAKNASFGIS